jgi:hypothetical protein
MQDVIIDDNNTLPSGRAPTSRRGRRGASREEPQPPALRERRRILQEVHWRQPQQMQIDNQSFLLAIVYDDNGGERIAELLQPCFGDTLQVTVPSVHLSVCSNVSNSSALMINAWLFLSLKDLF